ncbi:DUF4013 domain-containing protein [Methanobrevibacter boviskoreani]|uniref:DUF4013 domain-containing protein n=1 Tax=Methanobrevibacter boviskoreani TaxID=1348249 RepID=UPI0006ACFB86|nr:DUF4013 domain-containing protein [Methanobrevibacter boviskoreani]
MDRFIDLFKNSLRYAVSDWKAIFILGVFLYIISYLEDTVFKSSDIQNLSGLIFIVILFAFSLIESGYSCKILEETVDGSEKPPIFANYLDLIRHGLKDELVVLFYMIIIGVILFFCFELEFYKYDFFVRAMGLFFVGLIYLTMLGGLLNLAHHHGNFKSGFAFREILDLLDKIGICKLVMVYSFIVLSEFLIYRFIFVDVSSNGIVSFIVNFLIIPFFVIFSKRLFALSSL